jgi:hypothetical protein
MTTMTVVKAKGQPYKDAAGKTVSSGEPGYYALLPLTIPADIATAPIQAIIWCYLKWSVDHYGIGC